MTTTLKKSPSMLSVYRRALTKKQDLRYQVGEALPALALALAETPVNGKHLRHYNAVCGFDDGDYLPATYPQILAFPLQLEMLLDRRFPFPLLGLVHISNRIEVLKPIPRKARLNIAVALGEQRVVEKGVEVDVDTAIHVEGELHWRGTATMLARCKTGVAASETAHKEAALESNQQVWSLSGGLGRSYGMASGDLNPIHLTAVTARLFGFKRAIAHGMWSKARCLAALDGCLPPAPYTVDVRFKRPIFLPARVRFAYAQETGGALRFDLWSGDGQQPHLSGQVTILHHQD